MKRRLLIGAFVAAMLVVPALAYAWNTNPLCYLFPKGSIEWTILGCDATEHNGSEG